MRAAHRDIINSIVFLSRRPPLPFPSPNARRRRGIENTHKSFFFLGRRTERQKEGETRSKKATEQESRDRGCFVHRTQHRRRRRSLGPKNVSCATHLNLPPPLSKTRTRRGGSVGRRQRRRNIWQEKHKSEILFFSLYLPRAISLFLPYSRTMPADSLSSSSLFFFSGRKVMECKLKPGPSYIPRSPAGQTEPSSLPPPG